MTDTITIRINVSEMGLPDITYRNKRIVTPETITLTYLADDPGPVNGIYPVLAQVEGPCRGVHPGDQGPSRTTEWFRRGYPGLWPEWLITFAADHRPQ